MIKEWIAEYTPRNIAEAEQALREIMQEIALAGLQRSGFFEKAAFYGGTALRIFYNLDRFSEDLDFSLLTVDPEFFHSLLSGRYAARIRGSWDTNSYQRKRQNQKKRY
jgi:predicted nucleotidyltransferase component of viral defense system